MLKGIKMDVLNQKIKKTQPWHECSTMGVANLPLVNQEHKVLIRLLFSALTDLLLLSMC